MSALSSSMSCSAQYRVSIGSSNISRVADLFRIHINIIISICEEVRMKEGGEDRVSWVNSQNSLFTQNKIFAVVSLTLPDSQRAFIMSLHANYCPQKQVLVMLHLTTHSLLISCLVLLSPVTSPPHTQPHTSRGSPSARPLSVISGELAEVSHAAANHYCK